MRRDRDRKFSDCARVAEQTQWRPMGWRQCLQGVLVALILSSISAIARPVDAAPDAPASERILHFDDRPLQLEVIVGFGTTVGISGLALDYSLRDMVALGVGAGLGIHGPLWEAHARFRPVLGHLGSQSDLLSALTVETAFSQGMYADFPDLIGGIVCEGDASDVEDHCFHANNVPRLTSFAQLELGWELRFPSGFGLRLSGGAASALHMATPRCTNAAMQTVPCGGPEPERTIVVLTSAFGYAF